MVTWTQLVHLGDLKLTVPLGAAMAAGLVVAGAPRPALRWSLLFASGLLVVGASKIVYMAWGGGWPAAGFKAVSGHATGASAVFAPLFALLLQRGSPRLRQAGAKAGLLLGVLVGIVLVLLEEHSVAEAIAGCLIGSLISLDTVRGTAPLAPLRPYASAATAVLVFLAASWLMQSAHIGYWMIRAARLLSGKHGIHPLTID